MTKITRSGFFAFLCSAKKLDKLYLMGIYLSTLPIAACVLEEGISPLLLAAAAAFNPAAARWEKEEDLDSMSIGKEPGCQITQSHKY